MDFHSYRKPYSKKANTINNYIQAKIFQTTGILLILTISILLHSCNSNQQAEAGKHEQEAWEQTQKQLQEQQQALELAHQQLKEQQQAETQTKQQLQRQQDQQAQQANEQIISPDQDQQAETQTNQQLQRQQDQQAQQANEQIISPDQDQQAQQSKEVAIAYQQAEAYMDQAIRLHYEAMTNEIAPVTIPIEIKTAVDNSINTLRIAKAQAPESYHDTIQKKIDDYKKQGEILEQQAKERRRELDERMQRLIESLSK